MQRGGDSRKLGPIELQVILPAALSRSLLLGLTVLRGFTSTVAFVANSQAALRAFHPEGSLPRQQTDSMMPASTVSPISHGVTSRSVTPQPAPSYPPSYPSPMTRQSPPQAFRAPTQATTPNQTEASRHPLGSGHAVNPAYIVPLSPPPVPGLAPWHEPPPRSTVVVPSIVPAPSPEIGRDLSPTRERTVSPGRQDPSLMEQLRQERLKNADLETLTLTLTLIEGSRTQTWKHDSERSKKKTLGYQPETVCFGVNWISRSRCTLIHCTCGKWSSQGTNCTHILTS